MSFVFFFFFQAEDGIRDYKVTGVQTCALPISAHQYAKRYKFISLRAPTIICGALVGVDSTSTTIALHTTIGALKLRIHQYLVDLTFDFH